MNNLDFLGKKKESNEKKVLVKKKTLLETINSPGDLKKINQNDLPKLAQEIREFMLTILSKKQGHISSNLGVTELSIALHYVANCPQDKIVWDVSHQAYIHKILTGRRKKFHTIRDKNGVSGFCTLKEGQYDCFGAGHASTSISAALGIAEARDHLGKNFDVYAVMGDGALGGGMAFEGLNNLGYLRTNLTVILNDNKMSISSNVGAMMEYLKKMSSYSEKRRQLGSIFKALGFKYYGPIDGHDMKKLIGVLQAAQKYKGPKLIHVLTVKGKGYKHAEEKPSQWHQMPNAFDLETGESNGSKSSAPKYTDVAVKVMIEEAEKNKKIVGITAAMASGVGLMEFAKKFPTRFYDVGIAEEHAVTFAAGLAAEEMIPVFCVYSTFMQRAFDQALHDVATQNLNVKFFLRNGIVDDGPTHHGIYDFAFMRIIPNMIVMVPKDENELRNMAYTALKTKGPISLSFPKGSGYGVKMDSKPRMLKIGEAEIVREGKDITIIAIGKMVKIAEETSNKLAKDGVKAEVINARFIKPLDKEKIIASAKKTKKVLTMEEGAIVGGFGSAVEELLEDNEVNAKIKRIAIPDTYIEHGCSEILLKEIGLTTENAYRQAKILLKK